jgi:hypothetical protein
MKSWIIIQMKRKFRISQKKINKAIKDLDKIIRSLEKMTNGGK